MNCEFNPILFDAGRKGCSRHFAPAALFRALYCMSSLDLHFRLLFTASSQVNYFFLRIEF